MWTARRVITVIMAVLGVLLIVRGAWGGVWPVSIQLVAGVLLLLFAALRWKYMR
jgi:drug/metabolite transporter (DMT)-like permease